LSTKEVLSDRLNELMDLEESVDFTKLNKREIEILLKIFENPQKLIRLGWKNLRDRAKKEILDEIMGRSFIDDLLKTALKKPKEGKGPLGFGLLPTIRERVRGLLEKAPSEG